MIREALARLAYRLADFAARTARALDPVADNPANRDGKPLVARIEAYGNHSRVVRLHPPQGTWPAWTDHTPPWPVE